MRAFRRLGEGRLLRAAAADALALSRLAFQQGAPAAR
jgi:hypothetical protein